MLGATPTGRTAAMRAPPTIEHVSTSVRLDPIGHLHLSHSLALRLSLTRTPTLCCSLSLSPILPLHVRRFVRNYDKKRFYLGLYLPPSDVRTD